MDRRHVLIASQVVQMSTALTLAALVYTGQVRIWHVLTLSVITGIAQAFGGPAHHSLMPSLVPKEHLPNAIAFNAIQFNVARVIGPLISGAALAAFGMAACFGLNGLSFVAVIIGMLLLSARPPAANTARSMKDEMRGGFAYMRTDPSLVGLATLGFMGTFLASPLLTFLPAFVQGVLGGDVTLYTRLMSWAGAGAVVGALGVAWLGKFTHMGRAVLSLQIAMGLVIVVFANTRTPLLNGALLFAGGACMVMVFAMLQSLVQLNAPNELRGRVMSIYMMAFRGGMPLGSLAGGWLANQFTAPPVLTDERHGAGARGGVVPRQRPQRSRAVTSPYAATGREMTPPRHSDRKPAEWPAPLSGASGLRIPKPRLRRWPRRCRRPSCRR